jgi:hypothetical protein
MNADKRGSAETRGRATEVFGFLHIRAYPRKSAARSAISATPSISLATSAGVV